MIMNKPDILKMWHLGDTAVLRGIINQKVWLAQSVIVLKDTIEETVLLLMPGARCAYPEGYWRWKQGDTSQGTRWQDVKQNAWKLRQFGWLNNRFLIFLAPGKYYAVYAIWRQAKDEFQGYYIDFQLPYTRTLIGFDSYDLELDIVIDPQFRWSWKDEQEYHEGIQAGVIKNCWVEAIGRSKLEALARIEGRQYPLDGSWLDWRPDPSWIPPALPENWMTV
jgi:hypothetical protein